MIRNSIGIADDIFAVLSAYLPGIISGGVYHKSTRPLDAETEDAVIIVSDADAEQIQGGHVHVNIYVPDIDAGTGNLVEDRGRLSQISARDEDIVGALNSALYADYDFALSRATDTFEEAGLKQHFVGIFIFCQ